MWAGCGQIWAEFGQMLAKLAKKWANLDEGATNMASERR